MPPSDIPISCIGVSHATAPLDLLERLSIGADGLPEALTTFGGAPPDGRTRPEVVVLSTCNRTEIYRVTGRIGSAPVPGSSTTVFDDLPPALVSWMEERTGLSSACLAPYFFRFDGWAAAEHLYKVACGLDSLIIGESQVLGQVARAYAVSQSAGFAGAVISTLFQSAIRVGRRARAQTGIGRGLTSVSAAAVRRVEDLLGGLGAARVLVLGAGEMGGLVLRRLRDGGAGHIDVVNRTLERAASAAARWGAVAHSMTDLPELLARCDAFLSATSSPTPLLTAEEVRIAVNARAGRPLVIVDIALPRAVDPAAASIPGVRLLDLGSLRDEQGGEDGSGEIARVQQIIAEELTDLGPRMAELALRPIIGSLWLKADGIRTEVLTWTRARLPQLDDESWSHVENLARALVAKLLHEPATRLRAEAGNGHARQYSEALAHLFDLTEPRGGDE
jgi:glutamyl-tRNA reductase